MSASPEEQEAIVERAHEDAAIFLRDEWRARKREVLFGPGGLIIIGALLSICVGPIFALDLWSIAFVLALILLAAGGWTALRWRCPRCEQVPIERHTLIAHKMLDPVSCPHCGLALQEHTSKEKEE